MLRIFKSKVFILILVTVSILIVMGVSARQDSFINRFGNVFSVPLSPLQKFFTAAGDRVEEVVTFFKDTREIKQENEALKQEIDVLRKENTELNGYKGRIDELKAALNLKDQLSEFDPVGANIIAKDVGNWFNVFTLDRGNKDGIEYNSPIISSRGLVGRIIQADAISAKAESIIDPNSVVYCRLVRTRELVRVKGDLVLKEQGLCRMDHIPVDVDIMAGDVIETSGVGGIYPKGILVGKVKEVRVSGNELNKYAIIEPAVDFRRLEEVIVLKNKTKEDRIGSGEK